MSHVLEAGDAKEIWDFMPWTLARSPQPGASFAHPFLLLGGNPYYNRRQKKSWYQLILSFLLEDLVGGAKEPGYLKLPMG